MKLRSASELGLTFSQRDRRLTRLAIKQEYQIIQRVHAITRDETLKPRRTTTNQPSRVPLAYNPALVYIMYGVFHFIRIFKMADD